MHAVHLRRIGKHVEEFILAITELFSLSLMAEVPQAKIN